MGMTRPDNRNQKLLIPDLPLLGKLEGTAMMAGAGVSAGGLSAKFTAFACTFLGLANVEIAALATGFIGMAWAANATSEVLSDNLARRYGLRIRETTRAQWDLTPRR